MPSLSPSSPSLPLPPQQCSLSALLYSQVHQLTIAEPPYIVAPLANEWTTINFGISRFLHHFCHIQWMDEWMQMPTESTIDEYRIACWVCASACRDWGRAGFGALIRQWKAHFSAELTINWIECNWMPMSCAFLIVRWLSQVYFDYRIRSTYLPARNFSHWMSWAKCSRGHAQWQTHSIIWIKLEYFLAHCRPPFQLEMFCN